MEMNINKYDDTIDPSLAAYLDRYSWYDGVITIAGTARSANDAPQKIIPTTSSRQSSFPTSASDSYKVYTNHVVMAWTCTLLFITLSSWALFYYTFRSKAAQSARSAETQQQQQLTEDSDKQPRERSAVSNETSKRLVNQSSKGTSITKSDDPPDLVTDDKIASKTPLGRIQPGTSPIVRAPLQLHQPKVEVPSFQPPTAEDVIDSLATKVTELECRAQKKGLRLKEDVLYGMAIHLVKHEYKHKQKEYEQYCTFAYDHHQRSIDRQIQAEQHKESVGVQREAHDWLSQLIKERCKCMDALNGSFFSCAVFGIALLTCDRVLALIRAWQLFWQPATTVTVANDTTTWLSWSQQQWPTIIPTCWILYDRMYICFNILVVLFLLWGAGRLFHMIGLPRSLETMIKTILILVCVVLYDLAPINSLACLVALLATLYGGAILLISWKFCQFKISLQKERIPSVKQLNECIDWFDTTASKFFWSYVGCGVLWIGVLMCTGDLYLIWKRSEEQIYQ